MHSVDLLEEALALAEERGIEVRQQWLGDSPGGVCRIGARWIAFVNLSLPAEEQLLSLVKGLRRCGLEFDTQSASRKLDQLLRAS